VEEDDQSIVHLDNGTVVFHCKMYKPYDNQYGTKCIRTYNRCPKYKIKKDMNSTCRESEVVFTWTEYILYLQMVNDE
jgi:hypothetical protein